MSRHGSAIPGVRSIRGVCGLGARAVMDVSSKKRPFRAPSELLILVWAIRLTSCFVYHAARLALFPDSHQIPDDCDAPATWERAVATSPTR